MKVLVVVSGNANSISPFVADQVKELNNLGVETDYFLIGGKGIRGYLKNLPGLRNKIHEFIPNIIHAHYGLSSLLASFQRKVPVVTTFHGSDINDKRIRIFSFIADKLNAVSIFVAEDLAKRIKKSNPIVFPCGVDLETFYPIEKRVAKRKMGLSINKKYILFSSSFNNYVKNYPLAKTAISLLKDVDIELLELKSYNRNEVATLINAVDLALMTSFAEGSPQFIKEAMACNCPIVSTDVGDVKEVIGNTEGCHITSFDIKETAMKINLVLDFSLKNSKTNGRKRIVGLGLDSGSVAKKIINIYKEVL